MPFSNSRSGLITGGSIGILSSMCVSSSSSAMAMEPYCHHRTRRQPSKKRTTSHRHRHNYLIIIALLTVAASTTVVVGARGGGVGGVLALSSAQQQQEEEKGSIRRNLNQPHHYQYHDAHPEAYLYESVSVEPLTFEPPPMEPITVDRDRSRLLLAEAGDDDEEEEKENDHGEYWIAEQDDSQAVDSGYEHDHDEGDSTSMDGGDSSSSSSSSSNVIPEQDYYDEDYGNIINMGGYHTEGGDYEMLEGGEVDEEEEGPENDDDGKHYIVTYDKQAVSRRLRRRLDNPIVENKYLTKKDSFRDESIPIFEPDLDDNGKFEIQFEQEYEYEAGLSSRHPSPSSSICGPDQQRATIRFDTDDYGHETSWKIVSDTHNNYGGLGGSTPSATTSSSVVVASGPPTGYRYADNRKYTGTLCLNPGRYRFEVRDKFNDGMCGARTGEGLYRLHLGEDVDTSVEKFASPSDCSINWGKRVHSFTIQAPTIGTSSLYSHHAHQNVTSTERELGGCSYVKIQFKIDKYGKETTVTLTGNGATQLVSRREVGAYQTKTMQKCVGPGTYTLRLMDNDGICCGNGKGWYKMYVNGHLLVSGGYFIGSKTHTVKIGSNWQANMSYRDREWLNAHNARRRRYHGGQGYVPLRWSRTLAADAKNHANRLGNNCKSGALTHASGVQDGENLAKNQGKGDWGKLYPATNIMGRWVEKELNWSYPKNAHYTQVVWRATQYVGCGESVRNYGNGYNCRVQVCRYIRPGNCGVRNGNWRAEAWKDDTQCGSCCPREGCFA